MGPFLVIGVRMGLVGLRELKLKENDGKLKVMIMTRPYTPFSCIIDGIQVTTHCTIGNKKLKLKNSHKISARFKAQNGKHVNISINSSKLEQLEKSLINSHASEEVEKLALNIASMPEKELLTIERE